MLTIHELGDIWAKTGTSNVIYLVNTLLQTAPVYGRFSVVRNWYTTLTLVIIGEKKRSPEPPILRIALVEDFCYGDCFSNNAERVESCRGWVYSRVSNRGWHSTRSCILSFTTIERCICILIWNSQAEPSSPLRWSAHDITSCGLSDTLPSVEVWATL
jgi:hypothetical protein